MVIAVTTPSRPSPAWLIPVIVAGLQIFAPAYAADFPIRVSEDRRLLHDASGRPFLLTGDSAWSLMGELSQEEADVYLADRQSRGFNAILVSLIEYRFSRNAPSNFYKEPPFEPGGNFVRPNDAYFANVDWVLRRARERGLLVLLVPCYLGIDGGSEGWYQSMRVAGPGALYGYGRYLGARYREFDNIIWVQGGDHDPAEKELVDAVARGIAEVDPSALQTFHGSPNTVGSTHWGEVPWLGVDTLYTYEDAAGAALKRHREGPSIPFILIESAYEGERGTNEQSLRAIAYGAILSGASGQVFGNNPVWHFSGPGLYEQSHSWRDALGSRGAASMTNLKNLFDNVDWWRLRPAEQSLVQAAAPGSAVAARSADGDLAVIYISALRETIVDSAQLVADKARWYDPSSGRWHDTTGVSDQITGHLYTVPRPTNDAGFSDWVLVLSKT
jgi:hypothetical protein